MAITPRTILTSAAPATVAVVSLYFFTVLGTSAFTCFTNANKATSDTSTSEVETEQAMPAGACDHVADRFGDDPATWSEFAWVNFAYCFDQQDDSERVIDTTRVGLQYHPTSEALYNLKGYHKISTGDHTGAIDTLREGMESVTHHRNGVMANNLAWAGLWEPREMKLDEARTLYIQSLAMSPEICETVHTGLFVEYAIANQASGLERYQSLKRFHELRNRYNQCLDRIDDGQWHTVVEIVGAAVLFADIDNTTNADETHPLMQTAINSLSRHHGHATVDDVCQEAMPLADFHHACTDALERGMERNKEVSKRHEQRNERAAQVREEIVEQFGSDYPVLQAEPASSGCDKNSSFRIRIE